ncbi:MAG: DedA family protein [Bacteroidales bacterium]|nr:DedA family protein [Bacteroidales bacterium]
MEWLESLGLLGLFIGSLLAATILPFSSDVIYLAVLASTGKPLACLLSATAGSWIGSVITYYLGRIGKWEWIERWFKVTPQKLEKQRVYVNKYGVWLALVAWLPFVGDISVLALGFYRSPKYLTFFMLLIGKLLRYLFWNIVTNAIF